MGTTGTALAAGGINYVLVAAVEGYENLITNGDTSAVVTAFAALSGGDWTTAIGGLFAEVDNEQAISPWEPMHGGGRCTLSVIPDEADTFGIAVNRRAAGWESELDATADRDDTTITVKNAAGAASSGTAYIGTEALAYTGKTATTLTGVTRGKWSPFGPVLGGRFAQHHRVGLSPDAVQLAPLVSAQPRTWIGRWVGLWMVRSRGGVLDTVAEAQLIYAGKIAEIRDDPNHFGTVLDLRHVLDVVREATVGRQMWRGESKEGIHLKQGMSFTLFERADTTEYNATALSVMDTPSGANQIPTGYYTVEQLHSRLNSWFAAELAAARIVGAATVGIANTDVGWRTTFTHVLTTTPKAAVFTMPAQVAEFFGFGQAHPTGIGYGAFIIAGPTFSTANLIVTGTEPALKSVLFKVAGSTGLNFGVETSTGVLVDQYDSLPTALRPPQRPININAVSTDVDWGCFTFDNKVLMRGAWIPLVGDAQPPDLLQCYAHKQVFASAFTGDLEATSVPYDDSPAGTITVRQVMIFESTLATFLRSIFYSTGTSAYNSATYDALPFGSGIGIPGVLLGAEFEDSIAGLPGADESLVVVIDKPHTLADLLQGDLVLRMVFPVWRDQHLRFASWRTPDTGAATYTLTEANKAEPSGSATQHRSSTAQTTEWQRPIVKIQYNRNFSDLSADGFQDSLTLEDRTAIDDAGGDGAVVTIKARNTFGQFAQTGAAVESLVPAFLAAMPLFSRPQRKVTRSIDARFFESVNVGDVVLFSDAFARDPETGTRGIAVRPAMITKHRWSLGGAVPGSDQPADMGGEVDLFFTDRNVLLGDALYAPCADIDHTYTTGTFTAGYSSTTTTIYCVARAYNQSVSATINGVSVLLEEATDATYFAAGYAVRIVERDPADINNPQVWTTTVVSQTGDTIELAAPLTGHDSDKRYRITFDDFDACATAQKLKAFQADPTDGLILDASGAYLYKSGAPERNWTSNDASPVLEMIPALAYADGAGRDVGHETAMVLLLDNLLDYKTGINQPVLFAERGNTANAGSYELVYLAPVWLTREGLSNAVTRDLSVSLLHRSTDGTSATVRVSLCRARPISTSRLDVERGAVYAEMYRTTTSTSYVASTVTTLDAAVKDGNTGRAWLLIECSYKAATLGVPRFQEGPRTQPQAWTL